MKIGAALVAAVGLQLAACATNLPDIAPGERPALDTDEAGFWMQMDRVENELRTSGRVVRDPVVNDYVTALVCTMAPDYCDDIRVYVVETPEFNASMRPNGAMEVWTGLMIRAANEAQLAFVLAHEIAHFQSRHTLERLRALETTTAWVMFLKLAFAAAGHGYVGDLAELAALAGMLGFSREAEREADERGMQMLVDSGYDPAEAPKIWTALIAELDAADEDQPPVFFSTHPSSEERVRTLTELANAAATPESLGVTGRDRYLGIMQRIRADTMRDELRQRRFERSQVLLTRLLETGVAPGEVEYYRGELYLTRRGPGDEDRAIAHFESAIHAGGAPAETHRELGLIYRRRGDRTRAAESFRRYLELLPRASDRLMIQAYLEEVQ